MALVVGYVSFLYADLLTTYDNSIILLSGCYHGLSPLDLYDYSIEMCRTPFAANYNFLIYLIWSVWNAPVLLACRLTGTDYLYSAFGHLCCKTLLVVGLLVAGYLISRILRRCDVGGERRALAIFVLFSSPIVYSTTLIETGIDIIGADLMLLGIAMLLEGSQLGFLVCFALATPYKMFALFLSLPILLLVDKNVLRAFAKWVSTTILLVVEKLLFSHSPAYGFALASQSREAIAQLLATSFSRFSVFITVFVAVVVYCYLHRGMGEGRASLLARGAEAVEGIRPEEARTLLYVCLVVFGTFIAFVPGNNYWAILYVPFFALVCALSRGGFAPALVALETVGSVSYFLAVVSSGSITVNEGTAIVDRMLLPFVMNIPGKEVARYASPKQFLELSPLGSFSQAFLPLFVGCMLVALVLASPRFQERFASDAPTEPSLQAVLPWLRGGFLVAEAALVIYAYTATTSPLVLSTATGDVVPASQSLVEGDGHELRQAVKFDQEATLSTLTLRFDNPSLTRWAFGSVAVSLVDTSSNEVLWEDTLGVSVVEDEKDISLSLPQVEVGPGSGYEIRLVGRGDIQFAQGSYPIYPYVTTEHAGGDLVGTLTLDGVAQEGSLLFSLR